MDVRSRGAAFRLFARRRNLHRTRSGFEQRAHACRAARAHGQVDAQSYNGMGALRTLQYEIENSLRHYVNFCHAHGLAAKSECAFGTDPVAELMKLAEKTVAEFPNNVCFASKLIFARDSIFRRWLHNQTALALQTRLHLQGVQTVILPMKVG